MLFSHGLKHFVAKIPELKVKVYENGLNIMHSDSWKSAFELASEDPQKIFLKSKKNMKLSGFLKHILRPFWISYQLFEASFQ